ncbi:MAG: translation initiation factor IF-2 [Chloroflexi bacterium]|nr:translation initiation factor IF-2 [Chloroflexota bacterium]
MPSTPSRTAAPSAVGQRPAPRGGASRGGRPGGSGLTRGPMRPGGRPSDRRDAAAPVPKTLRLPATLTVGELAELMHESAVTIIRELMTKHGIMATINQQIDRSAAEMVAHDLDYEILEDKAAEGESATAMLERLTAGGDSGEELVLRPPVVTVMGHVDHGKTTLLDAIRQTKVAESEAGGITQHIGAYQVEHDGNKITFLDTPGHEAFTAMRARGAQVTDIAVIVVAADDGVQPQTIEAINHARAAKVPIIVAINKIDAPGANPDHVKQQLAENNVLIEEWGGDVPCELVSARQKKGMNDLLDIIILLAQLRDLKTSVNRPAQGTILEAKLDKHVGPVATALVQTGTLKVSDIVVAGGVSGRIRTMLNDRGKPVRKAEPSTPVSIMGLTGLPLAGDSFSVVSDERTARSIAEEIAQKRLAATPQTGAGMARASGDGTAAVKELNIVLKADVQGTLEALRNASSALANDEIAVNIIHGGVGGISENDILLAVASKALVLGFNVKVDPGARRAADQSGIEVRLYNIIYQLLEELEKSVTGMLQPIYEERITGHAEVRQIFRLPHNEVVAGCYVTDGAVQKDSEVRVLRRGTKVFEGKVASLRRFKDAVSEVTQGYECGIGIEDWRDLQVGDALELFHQERVR